MTNHQTHADMRNHCNNATITNHFSQAIYDNHIPHSTHDKPSHQSYPWQIILPFAIHDKLFPPFHTWKKTLDPCPMTNHCNYATTRNPFSHAIHDKPFHQFYHGKLLRPWHSWGPFHIFNPWKPWVLFHQDKLFHHCYPSQTISPIQSMTYHLSVNL